MQRLQFKRVWGGLVRIVCSIKPYDQVIWCQVECALLLKAKRLGNIGKKFADGVGWHAWKRPAPIAARASPGPVGIKCSAAPELKLNGPCDRERGNKGHESGDGA